MSHIDALMRNLDDKTLRDIVHWIRANKPKLMAEEKARRLEGDYTVAGYYPFIDKDVRVGDMLRSFDGY
jgi:hypothetical protein